MIVRSILSLGQTGGYLIVSIESMVNFSLPSVELLVRALMGTSAAEAVAAEPVEALLPAAALFRPNGFNIVKIEDTSYT